MFERSERCAGLVDLAVRLDRRLGLLRIAQQLLEALAKEGFARPAGHAAVGVVHEREHALEVDFEVPVLEAVDQTAEGLLGLLQPGLDHLARRPSLDADVRAAAAGHDRDGGVELELAAALVDGGEVLADGALGRSRDEPVEDEVVALAIAVGNEQPRRPADDLGGGPAEHPLGLVVPGCDDEVPVLFDEAVGQSVVTRRVQWSYRPAAESLDGC